MGDAQPAAPASGGLPVVGDLISGKYEIIRVIAEGGMGLVYEAKHIQLDEPFAIKFLRIDSAASDSAEMAERFVREARMPMKIKSEHVVRVLDIGKHDTGAPFMVMEMLVGQDLDTVVEKHGVLPIAQGIDYVLQACEALAEAHMLGVVHRDLKPANLFLTYRADGTACIKVLDFGISKLKDVGQTGKDLSITKTHTVMGSPRYMSPEQMRSSRNVDARADVWAIGIVLYELFTAGVPFDGESMPQICAAILEEVPKSIRAARPDIPAELEAVVMKCLEKKPDDRYSNIAQLAHALAPFASTEGRTSAERVGRVLRPSFVDFNTDTVPHELTIPRTSYPNISQASLLTPPPPLATTTGNAAKGVAWTDPNAPAHAPSKRKGGMFWGIASGLVLLLVGVGIMVKNRTSDQAPASAAAANVAAANANANAHAATEQPAAKAAAETTTPPAVERPADPPPLDTANATPAAASAKVAAGKKTNPSAKPVQPKPTAHATATGGTTASSPQPTQTASADIWGDRK